MPEVNDEIAGIPALNLTAKTAFQNFLAEEKAKKSISEDYLLFLKLLWSGFDALAPNDKNLRKIYILEQIEKYLTQDSFREAIDAIELPSAVKVISSQGSPITTAIKLKEINLVNFRGFQVGEHGDGRRIDFGEKATFFFAPNGGGKTSICEAIEWALTGDSSERSKRKAEPLGAYFQNNEKSGPGYNRTALTLTDGTIPSQSTDFDRCFLEKNRIEKFARFAVQPNSEILNALGELFGFSDVIEFFKRFGQDLSPTDNEKNKPEHEKWRTWLDWTNRRAEQERAVEDAKRDEKSADDFLQNLTGNIDFDIKKSEIEAQVAIFRAELEKMGRNYSSEFSAKEFISNIKKYLSQIVIWKQLKENIAKNAEKLDFENLFQSANTLFQAYKEEKCPLCDTPFEQSGGVFKRAGVVTNPRRKIERELHKLKDLTEWKSRLGVIESELRGQDFRTIRSGWQKIQSNLIEDNWRDIAGNKEKLIIPEIDFTELELKSEQGTEAFIDCCELSFGVDFSNLSELEDSISIYKKNRDESLKSKPAKEAQIQKLQGDLLKLQEQKNVLSAKQQVARANKEKLQGILDQAGNSEKFRKILNVYSIFYDNVQSFQSSSILKEGSEIDDYVTGFYRALNLYDNEGEKVKEIHFPNNAQDFISIKYSKAEDQARNALHLLSEGHLKTLGLSVLLARAVKYAVPVLIFDDAINAIDTDHRDNIACLLASSILDEQGNEAFSEQWNRVKEYLDKCQFVITSHDRFFDEKMANLFGKENQKRYVLYSGANGIDFCETGKPANFEAKIETFLKPETQDIRSAIFYCRIWLEELLLNIAVNFKKPSTKKQIEFENVIDRKTKQVKNPELGTIIRKLISDLNKDGTTADDKTIASILDEIYKENDGKYVWFFEILNQESHYRRFDHVDISNAPTSQEVQKVFEKIKEIYNIRLLVTQTPVH